MQDAAIARKYSQALLEESVRQNEVLVIQAALHRLIGVLELQPRVGQVLLHPLITPAEKQELVRGIVGDQARVVHFVLMLIERHRLNLFPMIVRQFDEAVDHLQKVEPVQVRVAYPMSDKLREQTHLWLEGWMKSKVRLNIVEDRSIIGGLIIQTHDRQADFSVRKQLEEIRQRLSDS